MGSDYKKPDATTVITRENYRSILWPLDIESLFFVGSATAARLRGYGINTIGDLALSERSLISRLLGKQGSVIHDYANGLDDTPVLRYDRREDIKSIGNGITSEEIFPGRRTLKPPSQVLPTLWPPG